MGRYGGRLDCESVAHVQVVLDDGTDVMPPYTGLPLDKEVL